MICSATNVTLVNLTTVKLNMQELCRFLYFFSPPRGHSDDEPLRFPLGERVDGLEEISRAEEQHGLTELTVNSCFPLFLFCF